MYKHSGEKSVIQVRIPVSLVVITYTQISLGYQKSTKTNNGPYQQAWDQNKGRFAEKKKDEKEERQEEKRTRGVRNRRKKLKQLRFLGRHTGRHTYMESYHESLPMVNSLNATF